MLVSFFRLKEHGTTVKPGVLSGITTFMTVANINTAMLLAFFIASPVYR